MGNNKQTAKNTDLNKDDLINLLGHYLQILPPRWQGLQTYISIYITLVTGILGATIAGLSVFKEYPFVYFLEFGPLLIFSVSQLSKQTIRRQNQHIKELIVVIAKLEYEIGLYKRSSIIKDKDHQKPWPDDTSYFTPKWLNARLKSGNTSEKFVKEFQWSSAKFAYIFFFIAQIFSIFIGIAIAFLPRLM